MRLSTRTFTFIIIVCLVVMISSQNVGSTASTHQANPEHVIIPNAGSIVNVGSRKIIWRTSWWLCNDPLYGINGTDPHAMPNLVDMIHASTIMIYFRDDISDHNWNSLKEIVGFWKSKGKVVWLMIGKGSLNETEGTPQSIQYVIDTFKDQIAGIIVDAWGVAQAIPPAVATQWLLEKKNQLANSNMAFGYYHGDGFSPHYGDPLTDVDASYLAAYGLIPMAWLRDNNSWKPANFSLPRFWVDYDILTALQSGGPEGQSSEEIYNQWYLCNVIKKDQLKSNAGCEGIVFMAYTADSWPNPDAVQGMINVANDWLK
jgi:hypothetical protein